MHRRFLAVAVFALLAVACNDATEPEAPAPEPSEPELESLGISGGRGLQPAFAPEITRYSVVAADPAGDDLEFELTFADGLAVLIDFVDDPYSHLCGQHTARLLSDGNLLLFDNGQLCWPEDPSRGELTRVAEHELDESGRTATLVWSYAQEGAYSRSQGSAQRLANGNTLIGWGNGPGLLATEVTPDGEKAWEIYGELEGERVLTYRAFRGSH